MSKFEISVAYPFMSFGYALVLLLSVLLLHEPIMIGKVLGMGLICAGIIATVKF
jgi:undecaprenyl phosphate-alpha-L-ara4N flippase subunit ArnF